MKAILERIEKLLRLAGGTSSPEEAASAAAKAQELLTLYNLDASALGQSEHQREQEKFLGGFYEYQRDIWSWVAELNFCLYWTQRTRMYRRGANRWVTQQKIVGKKVNIEATKAMAGYLLQAIDRQTRIFLADGMNEKDIPDFGKLVSSRRAMSFREGCAQSIVWKLYQRREEALEKEQAEELKAAQAAAEAATKGVSSSTALTLASLVQTERDANMDFLYGEGWSAQQRAKRAEAARKAREEEEAYTAWALAHPEEAARKEAERLKEAKSSKGRGSSGPRKERDWGAFSVGQKVGKTIGIDPQADQAKRGLLQ